MTLPNEKKEIIEVGIEAAVQFAKGNAVRISHKKFQIAELTNIDITLFASFWKRDKAFERHGFNMDLLLSGNL